MHYIYLHGFASSPQSAKAQDLRDRFAHFGIPLAIPDLNQEDFTHLTLTRQIQQVAALLPPKPEPVTLIGSSFGGLTAAWLGEQHLQIQRLVLLAPAFGFLAHWLPRLGDESLHCWKAEGYLQVFHYGEQTMLPLAYEFVEDAACYDESTIRRSLPTLLLHGQADDVIPLQASILFAQTRPWVRLIPLNSDHALTDVSELIWQAIQDFCLSKASRS
jgi:hypothetical protein